VSTDTTESADVWIHLRTVSMMGLAPYAALSEMVCEVAPIPVGTDMPEILVDDGSGVRSIRSSALHKWLGDELAAKVKTYQPVWSPITPSDNAIVGFSENATPEEITRLCQRRGVLTNAESEVDRKGFELLGKLLTEEKRIARFLSHDHVLWHVALPYIERTMTSPVVHEVEPAPAPEPTREPWEPPVRRDVRREKHRGKVRSDHGSLFVERCKLLGLDCVSYPDGMGYAQERWCRMFELFCVLGINPRATWMSIDGQIMPRYHAMQTRAYDNVMKG
jgi:hypothetical protein